MTTAPRPKEPDMSKPGAPRWFERLPSWGLSAAALALAPLTWLAGRRRP